MRKVFDQKCRPVVVELLGTRGTSLDHPGSGGLRKHVSTIIAIGKHEIYT